MPAVLKILHVGRSYRPAIRYGGPVRAVHGLCRALAARGHAVTVFTTAMDGPRDAAVPLGRPVEQDGVEVWYFAARHLRRLERSAAYFGFPLDREALDGALADAASCFFRSMRVRLLLGVSGAITVEAAPLPAWSEPVHLAWAPIRTRSGDCFLRHKTTRREVYDEPLKAARASGRADELVFVNERGEVTECATATLFLRRGDALVTPPLRCGVLPGVLRDRLVAEGRAREAVVRPGDLAGADEILVGNAVRGLARAELVEPQNGHGSDTSGAKITNN